MKTERLNYDQLSDQIISSALEVHRKLGPGLLPSVYAQCLTQEFETRGIHSRVIHPQQVYYKGTNIKCDSWIDLIVDTKILLELRNVEQFFRVYEIQLLASMKEANTPVGLFINFNMKSISKGIRRFWLPSAWQKRS